MPLRLYEDTFWFPDGTLSANVEARVFTLGGPVLADLWANEAGTIPLPNPLLTDGLGVLTFWAEQGDYWLHINELAFRITVSGAFSTDLTTLVASTMSTGVVSGGIIDLNVGNPKAIDLGETVGYVIDNFTDIFAPNITRVEIPAQTLVLDGPAQARSITWWLASTDGTISQQANNPTPAQRRSFIVLGATFFDTVSQTLLVDQSLPVIIRQGANQLADLMDALAPFSLSGNMISPNGANLLLNKTSGNVFSRAFNYSPGTGDNPHESSTAAQSPVTFRRILRAPQVLTPPLVTTIDPANFDSAGVLTPVGGGAGSATIQRVWLVPENDVNNQVVIQYGQTVYASIELALERLKAGTFVPNPTVLGISALIAYIVVTRAATDLSNAAQAQIVRAGKFDTP